MLEGMHPWQGSTRAAEWRVRPRPPSTDPAAHPHPPCCNTPPVHQDPQQLVAAWPPSEREPGNVAGVPTALAVSASRAAAAQAVPPEPVRTHAILALGLVEHQLVGTGTHTCTQTGGARRVLQRSQQRPRKASAARNCAINHVQSASALPPFTTVQSRENIIIKFNSTNPLRPPAASPPPTPHHPAHRQGVATSPSMS